MPHVQVDVATREVRVDCLAVKASYPLEFLACRTNSNEYESVVRTDALPSQVHEGLLMIGLKAGQPIHFDATTKAWVPPSGDRVRIRFRYGLAGKQFDVPAYQWMRDVNTHKPATAYSWCFSGSTLLPDGSYAADGAGPIVGVINNQLSVLDVPALQSRALDARQWERDSDAMPPTDTPVTMVLMPDDPSTAKAP